MIIFYVINMIFIKNLIFFFRLNAIFLKTGSNYRIKYVLKQRTYCGFIVHIRYMRVYAFHAKTCLSKKPFKIIQTFTICTCMQFNIFNITDMSF